MPIGSQTVNTNSQTEDTTVTTEDEEEEVVNTNIPDIELVVEDGSGLSNSNSYCDLDFALEYCVMKGYSSWNELSESEQKIYLIRGSEFVDNFYQWKGRRTGINQAMSFPRVDIYDNDSFPVHGIPLALKKACIEAAFLHSNSSKTTLFSQKDENGAIKKKKVDVIEKEYFESASETSSSVNYTSIYDILNKLLKGLYKTKEESGINTRAVWLY